MDLSWLEKLIFGPGVAQSIFLIAIVIALGILLGKIKVFGVSLGVTLVLFVGILFGHFGISLNHEINHFFKEFGLILFVYSVGLQVGPSFFASLKEGGLKLNALAASVVLLGVGITIALFHITGLPMSTMVGILSGAVTNTPGLGAAEQTFREMHGTGDPSIATGYAVAYPLGVVGIITSLILIRSICRINIKKEEQQLLQDDSDSEGKATALSLVVKNPAIYGKTLQELRNSLDGHDFVISRTMDHASQRISLAHSDTKLFENDRIFIITSVQDTSEIAAFIGETVDMDRKQWIPTESELISKRFVITNSQLNGRKLGDLQLRRLHGMNVTRINRAGVEMVATASLPLQVGDKLTIVGSEAGMGKMEEIFGNSLKRLNEPNLIAIFLGIALGVLLGSIPIAIPGIPQPIKLGLAGGPLIIAILLSRFGYRYKLITYTTPSANLMLRETGISVFLACVGLAAGEGFVKTILEGGYIWVGYGIIITMLPLLIVGLIGRYGLKLNYLSLTGLLAGSSTDPPALAYANTLANHDAPAISYATVYPLTMFLRVLTAQLLILLFC